MRRTHIVFLLIILAAAFGRQFLTSFSPSHAPESPLAALIKEAESADIHGDRARAIALYTSALDDPARTEIERRDLLRRRGSVREWSRDYAGAEVDLNAAVVIKPADADVYFRRAYFYQRRARYDEALVDFEIGKGLHPADAWFDFGEGEVYAARANHQAAIRHFSEAVRLNPKMTRAYLERASEYNYVQMFREARQDYDFVLADQQERRFLPPHTIGLAYLGRGYAALHLNDYRGALADFDQVLKTMPDSSNALAWRGGAHQGLGDREGAEADYKSALAISPSNAYARDNLKALLLVR